MFAYIPHGHCYLWQANLVWLHLLSDSLIAIAYYSIPLALIFLVRKREDLPFNWIVLLFAGFIVSCGTTHLMGIWTLWHPDYWIAGSLKAITAIISGLTAFLLWRSIPQLLQMPNLTELMNANMMLKNEVEQRQAREAEIQQLNATLEKRVAQRTADLEASKLESEESRQQLQAILDNTTSVIYIKDLEGRLTLINQSFADLFEQKAEEMLGLSDFDYLGQDGAVQVRHNDQQALAQRSPIQFEEEVYIRGEYRTYISSKFPLYNQQGHPFALGGISTDITEQKQAKQELEARAQKLSQLNHRLRQAYQQLETKNQELDQFTYIVSHDLKAPLRAISNLSEWIEEDLEAVLTDDTRHQMHLLRDRVSRMDKMIQGLLEYSRVGPKAGECVSVDVAKLLTEVIDLLAPAPGLDIRLVTPMPVLETEKLPLSQVFMNLLSNAIKHHHLTDGWVEVSAHPGEQGYEFSVADNGPGIKPEDQERIFDIFESLAPSQSSQEGTYNTGIGLSIVKKIVSRQGGTISLQSQVGEGSRFSFTWPI